MSTCASLPSKNRKNGAASAAGAPPPQIPPGRAAVGPDLFAREHPPLPGLGGEGNQPDLIKDAQGGHRLAGGEV